MLKLKFEAFLQIGGENMISHGGEKINNFFLLLEFGQFKTLRRYSLRTHFDILNLNPPSYSNEILWLRAKIFYFLSTNREMIQI